MSKYIIVGGVAGGATAAARLRRLDEHAEIVLFERGEDISFANCGLPYYVGDVIAERGDLLLQTPEKFRGMYNVDVRVCSEVTRVNTENRTVEVRSADGVYTENYDALLLSPGAKPLRPPIPSINHPRIATLRSVQDADRIRSLVGTGGSVVVVGGGFIGVELAENLRERGLSVTLVEAMPHILPIFDTDMILLLEDELRRHGVELALGDGVAGFEEQEDGGICYVFPVDVRYMGISSRLRSACVPIPRSSTGAALRSGSAGTLLSMNICRPISLMSMLLEMPC